MTGFWGGIFEIVVNLCEGLIETYFICNFINHNFKTPKGKISYVLASVLNTALTTFMDNITLYDWWESFVSIAGALAISCVLFNGKFIAKLFAAVLSDVVATVSGNFVTTVLSAALKFPPEQLYASRGVYRFLGCVMFLTLRTFLYSLILKYANKTIFALKKKEWILMISVLLISILSFGVIQAALNEDRLTETTSLMLLVCEIGLLALNIICLYVMISLNKSSRAAEELKLKEQQQKHDIRYAETVRGQYEEIRGIRHDIKQHLAVISSLQLERKYDEASKYISEISSKLAKIEMFTDVGNDFVNAIINSKLSIAKSKGIEVICGCSGSVSGIGEYDLCNLIGNMLDNATEAAERSDNAVVELLITSDKYKLTVKVSNSIAESVLTENPALKTSKANRAAHGFGTKSIRTISEKYGGNTDIYEDGFTFVCRVELCKKKATEIVPTQAKR